MIFQFFYNFVLLLFLLFTSPKLLYDYFIKKKYHQSLKYRLGCHFPKIEEKKVAWIHAVSLGETKAVVALAKKLKIHFPDIALIISSVTETGHAEAKKSIPEADYHVYMPIDLSFIIDPIIKNVKPTLVLISETDLWYNFLKASKKVGAQTLVVNGKISERSCNRYSKIPFFSRKIFSLIDLFCLQNSFYAQLFSKLVIPSSKLYITGNLKIDEPYPILNKTELSQWRTRLKIHEEDFVLVIGSTHDPEEKILLENLRTLFAQIPYLKIILIPRHPERFDRVANLLTNDGYKFSRYSEIEKTTSDVQVILGDAMGVLRKFYQIADIAIVAGSYTEKVGGHNVLEPCCYGVPVIFGPFMHSQKELKELVLNYKAGLQIEIAELSSAISDFYKNSEKKIMMGKRGRQIMEEMNGATDRTWNVINNLI